MWTSCFHSVSFSILPCVLCQAFSTTSFVSPPLYEFLFLHPLSVYLSPSPYLSFPFLFLSSSHYPSYLSICPLPLNRVLGPFWPLDCEHNSIALSLLVVTEMIHILDCTAYLEVKAPSAWLLSEASHPSADHQWTRKARNKVLCVKLQLRFQD